MTSSTAASAGIVEGEFFERCSHALVADGRVWVIDPVGGEGVEQRIRSAGQPAGVIRLLLERHNRDSRPLAERLGVPLHVLPREGIEGAPFEFRVVCNAPKWRRRRGRARDGAIHPRRERAACRTSFPSLCPAAKSG